MELAEVEIDPQLFIKCRLCLEDMGVYQIIPTVQHQIKYCFDIDVEPYDSLPQLICKICKGILTEYHSTKKKFLEKQRSLKNKINSQMKPKEGINEAQHETVTSSQQIESEVDVSANDSSLSSNKTSSIFSNLVIEDTDCNKSTLVDDIESNRSSLLIESSHSNAPSLLIEDPQHNTLGSSKFFNRYKKRERNEVWTGKRNFTKYFVCRFCRKYFKRLNLMLAHIKSHDKLISRHEHIFQFLSKVNLSKIDSKPNFTGMTKSVALSEDKILYNGNNVEYFILYLRRGYSSIQSESLNIIKKEAYSDSSDDNYVSKRKTRKRRRITSISSNETEIMENDQDVVNESANKIAAKIPMINNDNECISIDDTSNDSYPATSKDICGIEDCSERVIPKASELKAIQNIISTCSNKYLKKLDISENDSSIRNKKQTNHESQLKHKLLSIGTKIINKSNFSCTGLLRYLEYKNLDINWITVVNSKESNVRIKTKLKEVEESDDNSVNWTKVPEIYLSSAKSKNKVTKNVNTLLSKNLERSLIDIEKENRAIPVDANENSNQRNHQTSDGKTDNTQANDQTKCNISGSKEENIIKTSEESLQKTDLELATCYKVDSELLTNKLLNANPVANPKQLPKKNTIETKPNLKLLSEESVSHCNEQDMTESNSLFIDLDEVPDVEILMPVITSTTSLASKESKEESVTSSDIDKKISDTIENSCNPQPRIKVKPVSELMPERTLQNLSQTSTSNNSGFWPLNHKQILPTFQAGNPQQIQNSGNVPQSRNHLPGFQTSITSQNTVTNNFRPILQNAGSTIQQLKIVGLSNNGTAYIQNCTSPNVSSNMHNATTDTSSLAIHNISNESAVQSRDCVTLDSIDFPNTKTDSPFRYLKNILMIHGIVLLDTNEVLSTEFNCLIRFKLEFRQDNNEHRVTLCLSLFCNKEKFCLKVKDVNQENININKISANWQWEILKAYMGDVGGKLLQNAEKVSPVVYEYTKSFLCLLKSINNKT